MKNHSTLGKNIPHRPDYLARELATILDTMPDGLFTVDRDGRIELWNKEMTRLTGYTAEEVVGGSCHILGCVCCQGGGKSKGSFCDLLQGDEVERQECPLRHRDGTMIPVMKNARVIRNDSGEIIGAVETLTDLRPVKRLEAEVARYRSAEAEAQRLGRLVGKSHAMREVYERIRLAAASDVTVLLLGETGTGKELAAEAIHQISNRREGPLVKVNCSALPETLLESELFGHEKGAFTGAIAAKPGRFEMADHGTIFLDEIGDISPLIQLKLLRVIQEHEFERVGGTRSRQVDVRVIAATHRDLCRMVEEEEFRWDLFYRLHVFAIQLPPLRERREDIPLLVRHFIEQFNQKTGKQIEGITHEAALCLMDYCWPGNVRELENAIEHAFVTCPCGKIGIFDLPVEIRMTELRQRECERAEPSGGPFPEYPAVRPGGGGGGLPARAPGRIATKEQLLDALRRNGWNKAEVARVFGVARTTVWRKMRAWNIPLEAPDSSEAALE